MLPNISVSGFIIFVWNRISGMTSENESSPENFNTCKPTENLLFWSNLQAKLGCAMTPIPVNPSVYGLKYSLFLIKKWTGIVASNLWLVLSCSNDCPWSELLRVENKKSKQYMSREYKR